MRQAVGALFILFFALSACGAATIEELQRYDKNGNQIIDVGAELELYIKHQVSPQLAALDVNNNGIIDDEDIRILKKKIDESFNDTKALTRSAAIRDQASRKNGIPLKDAANKQAPKTPGCESGLYIRRDQLDIAVRSENPDKSTASAKGAQFSYTDDRMKDTQTAEIHGVVSYIAARSPCIERPKDRPTEWAMPSGYAFAGWISGDGKLSSNRKTEKSALKFGASAQVEILGGPFFDLQYLSASPYYQTDFRGHAKAYGFTGAWQPYLMAAKLGGSNQQISPYFDFFWQLKADVTGLRVDEPGQTSLKANTDYLWLGGTVRGHVFLFPEYLNYRLSLVGTYKYYWDERSREEAKMTTAAVAYNLTDDGSTSISFEYQRGTDKDTLDRVRQYVVSLNYKF